MDRSDQIRFEPVIAAGLHLHCYLDSYYIARITPHADHCAIDGPGFAPCHVPDEEQAREVVRMWVRLCNRSDDATRHVAT